MYNRLRCSVAIVYKPMSTHPSGITTFFMSLKVKRATTLRIIITLHIYNTPKEKKEVVTIDDCGLWNSYVGYTYIISCYRLRYSIQ